MSPQPIQSPDEAKQYLIEAFGTSREYRMYPFDLGWVIYPILSEEEISQGRHIGLTKMVLDAHTRVITEFPSLPVPTVAQMYTEAIQHGTPIPGGQIYPRRTRLHLHLIRDTPTTVEYLIRPESTTDPHQPTANYLLVIDKSTRLYQPPGTMTTMAASWIQWSYRMNGAWPEHGTTEY
ncbi:hypothetical protein [Nocardia transvalensis]|uniref:hypothetical protein n=1 Tax=Nocardia transvalensis TaxID=37333 RepID=UPI001E5DF740|nr:hypothetical protein [Nocardia transvalensis]